jgi:hypothetical protein
MSGYQRALLGPVLQRGAVPVYEQHGQRMKPIELVEVDY